MNDEQQHAVSKGDDSRFAFLPRDRWMDDLDGLFIVGSLLSVDDRRIPIRVHRDLLNTDSDEEIESLIRDGLPALHKFDVGGYRDQWIRRIPGNDSQYIEIAVGVAGVMVTLEPA